MERIRWILLGQVLLGVHVPVDAAQWRITPSLTIRETYSDNINLRPDGEDAWVTEYNPGISANARGGRLQLNLNYRMQNLLSTQENRRYSRRDQLQANGTAELIKQSVFLDARASAGQTLINPVGRQTLDTLSDTGNVSNFYTVGISPYWRPHLGGYADGEVRLRYDYVTTSRGQASAAQTHTETINLQSGRRFTILTWQANFRNQKSKRTSGQDVQFRNAFGEVRYRWHRKFNTFVQGGFFDNDFRTQTRTNRNGPFWTLGAAWIPNRMLTLEGGIGRNSFATVRISPSRRTLLEGTYRRNKVGTNTGNVFQGLIQHRTRRTVWQGRYSETTTTTQTVLTEQQIFLVTDAFGNPILDPVTDQPILVAIDLPELVDEVFVRKRGELSFTGNTAKNTFNARVYQEKRIFQERKTESKVFGLSGSWIWRWGAKTNSLVWINWQKSDFSGQRGLLGLQGRNNIFWIAGLRISRRLTQDVNAYLEYRHQEQSSDISGLDYQENRAVAAITMRF